MGEERKSAPRIRELSKMEITIKIPDWAEERNISVLAGNEPFLIYSKAAGKWFVKTKRCNMCGKCCRDVPAAFPWRNEKGDCDYLKRETWNFPPYDGKEVFICTNPRFPFACIARNHPSKPHPDCCIEYKEVE